MLDERKAAILRELVEGYIRTGEPMSSRAIVEAGLDCSSATVRNELAVLEGDGYIMKPHTSAGRVPTDRGYRYYIDHLSRGPLRTSTQARIEHFFSSMHSELSRMLKETSDLLSEVTNYPAVVLGPGLRGQSIRDVHLAAVEPGVVLLVLVTAAGRVNQSVLRLATPVTPGEMHDVERTLLDRFDGVVIGEEGVFEFADDADDLPDAGRRLYRRALEAVDHAASDRPEVYLGGTSRMTALWEDLAKLHRILGLLDREASILGLIEQEGKGASVHLGRELSAGEDDLAVVSAAYEAGGASGRMGVFGPMRMDYRRTIRVVEEISDALGDSLGG
jgi:heat-inducible transcriptional repressor